MEDLNFNTPEEQRRYVVDKERKIRREKEIDDDLIPDPGDGKKFVPIREKRELFDRKVVFS